MSDSPVIPRAMTIEEFQPLLGRTFLVDCDPRTAELDLIEIVPGQIRPGGVHRSFILIFLSSPDVLLVPGMYKMKTGSFGPEMIYIERTSPPMDPNAPAGIWYQAIFN